MEGGFDFSALFLGLTAEAEGEVGQNPQDQNGQNDSKNPQDAQTSLLVQAAGATPDTLEADADGEGQNSVEAASNLLPSGAGLPQFIPPVQMQNGQEVQKVQAQLEPALLAAAEGAEGAEGAAAPTQPQPFSIGEDGDNVQNVQDAPNVQNGIDISGQDQNDAPFLSTRMSLRHAGLRTEPDVPEGVRESQLPLKNIAQTDLTLADRTFADRVLAGGMLEQPPGPARLGNGPFAQGQAGPATPYAMAGQQDDGLMSPNMELDVNGPELATQAVAGSKLFKIQAALKGLAAGGIQNDLEQPQAQQSRQFTETTSALGASGSVQDELQTSAVGDAQRAAEVRHNILERVAAEMAARVQLNQREARIQLSPPELGALKIELVVNGDQVQAHIRAEVAEVGRLLQNHLSDLKQMLQNQGLDLSSVQVDVSSQGDGQNGHATQGGYTEQAQQFQHDGGTPRGRQQPETPSQQNHGEGKTGGQQVGQAASALGSRSVNLRV